MLCGISGTTVRRWPLMFLLITWWYLFIRHLKVFLNYAQLLLVLIGNKKNHLSGKILSVTEDNGSLLFHVPMYSSMLQAKSEGYSWKCCLHVPFHKRMVQKWNSWMEKTTDGILGKKKKNKTGSFLSSKLLPVLAKTKSFLLSSSYIDRI